MWIFGQILMMEELDIYQLELRKEKINVLWEDWSQDSFENAAFFGFSHSGAVKNGRNDVQL
jgi:hypothetical protein